MVSFQFGNIVVDGCEVGVIVKSWPDNSHHVYMRNYNCVMKYEEKDIRPYLYAKGLMPDEAKNYT